MRYAELAISRTSPLSHSVHSIWRLRDDASDASAGADPILPDGHVEIVLNLADPFERTEVDGRVHRQALALFVGQQTGSARVRPTGRVHLFGIRFQHAGAAMLLGFPQEECRDLILSLDDLAPQLSRMLHDETEPLLADVSDDVVERCVLQRVIAHLEQRIERRGRDRVTPRLHERSRTRAIAMHASQRLTATAGRVTIEHLSRELGASSRQLERAFDEHVGVAPKLLARILRFQQACRLARARTTASWTDVALASGYFDQAHFIRDFRQFAGIPPTAFASTARPLSDVFVVRGSD